MFNLYLDTILLYRREKTKYAQPDDQQAMEKIYTQDAPITQEQAQEVLTIFVRTQTREYCTQFLTQHCQQARWALAQVATICNVLAIRARTDLEVLIDFVEGK
jgi:hypothetical protein